MHRLLVTVLAFSLMSPLAATKAHDHKNSSAASPAYHLFRPVPSDEMRDLNTDRPSQTDGPFTLDAGHVQIELDFVNWARAHDRENGMDTRSESVSVAPINLRIGVLSNLDLQFIWTPHVKTHSRDRVAGETTRQSGAGDFTLRAKYNFWGNDGGTTALGLLPYITFPTGSDAISSGALEGGISLPFTVNLPGDFQLGLMTRWNYRRNDEGSGYHSEWDNSVILSRSLVGPLSGYIEFFSSISSESSSRWVGSIGTGLTYGLTENTQIDAGINFGVTDAATDLNPWIGFAIRF